MFLLDTNVVSELRKPRPHGGVLAWIAGVDDACLHLHVVTLAEIQAGIEITREQDPAKAAEIERWLDQVAMSYNVLAMDAPTFRLWARLMHRRSDTLYEDAMIAATARTHDLTVVTRNVADFEPFRVRVLDPFRRLGGLNRVCVTTSQEYELRGRGRMYTFEHSGPPSNMSTTMTVRLEDDVKHRLDALAQATRRSKSFLAAEAIRAYVDTNEWQVGEIQAALEEADAGDFAGDNDVAALARKWKVDAG